MSKHAARPDAIWKVCQLMEYEYVNKLGDPDMATFELWHSDSLARFREGYRVQEMRTEHQGIVDSALLEWRVLESPVLGVFDGSHDKFVEWFTSLHAKMWREKSVRLRGHKERGHNMDYFCVATEVSRRTVNYQWCTSFGVFLPLSIPGIRPALARVGMTMSCIYYLEMIAKEIDRNTRDGDFFAEQIPLSSETFERIDSCWLRAKELC